jgi:hypothetical protein
MYGGGAEDEELNTSGSVNLVEESDVGMSGGRGRRGGRRGGRRAGAGSRRGGRDSTGAGSRRGGRAGKGGFAGLIGQAVLPFGLLTLQQRMAEKSRRATRGGKGKGKGGRKTRRHYRGRKGGDVA